MFWRRDKKEEIEKNDEPAVSLAGAAAGVVNESPSAETPSESGAGETSAVADAAESAASGSESDAETPQSGEGAPVVTQDLVIDAIRTVFDPEIPVNVYELGLIYGVLLRDSDTRPDGTDVDVKMTLTSPHCPVAETLPGDVARAVRTVTGVGEVDVEVVWDPTWNPDMMSEAAKLELGMF